MTTLDPAQRLRLGVRACLLVAILVLTSAASANGRFPRAQRLIVDPNDSAHLVLSATYGLLVTSDQGVTWHYVCEAAFGERDTEADALTALTPQGVLLAGIYSRVSRTAASPCDFERTLGMTNREAVPDFALVGSRPGHVVAVLATRLAAGTWENQLQRSEDDGGTWAPIGSVLPESIRLVLTVDVAPSDETRVYLSGLGPDDEGVLLRSNDGGESFETFAIPSDPVQGELPFIAAVDPANPDALYLRTDLWAYDAAAGVANANDALLYSSDGGVTFSELLRAGAKLFGFSFSPDGTELMIGYGDPKDVGGGRVTDPEALGIYRARSGSSDFAKQYAGSVGCLTWTAEGLYVCTHEADTDFTLGLVSSADFDLDAPPSFEPLLRLRDVVGPLDCAACSAGAVCDSYWLSACQSWGRADCAPRVGAVCPSEGGAPTSTETGGASNETGGTPSPAGGAGATTDADAKERSGCACRSGGPGSPISGWVLLGLLAWARRRLIQSRCRCAPYPATDLLANRGFVRSRHAGTRGSSKSLRGGSKTKLGP